MEMVAFCAFLLALATVTEAQTRTLAHSVGSDLSAIVSYMHDTRVVLNMLAICNLGVVLRCSVCQHAGMSLPRAIAQECACRTPDASLRG